MSDWKERCYKRRYRGIEGRMIHQKGPCCPNCGKPTDVGEFVGCKYKSPFAFKRNNGGRTTSDLLVCRCMKCGTLYTIHFFAKTQACLTNELEYIDE